MKLCIILLFLLLPITSYTQSSGHVKLSDKVWTQINKEYDPTVEKLYCLSYHKELLNKDTIAVIDSAKLIGIGDRLSVEAKEECHNPTLHTHPPEYPTFDGNDYMMMFNSKIPFFCVLSSDNRLSSWPDDPFSRDNK